MGKSFGSANIYFHPIRPHQGFHQNVEVGRDWSSPFWMGLTNPSRALGRFSLLMTLLRAFVSVRHPALFHKPISDAVAFPFAFFGGLNLFFLTGAFAWCFKMKQLALFKSVQVLRKNSYLTVFFSPFSSTISQHLSLTSPISCCLYADDLAI